MTDFRMTTHASDPWGTGASAGHPHKHVRDGRPRHHAASSPFPLRTVLLLLAVALVVAAAILVARG